MSVDLACTRTGWRRRVRFEMRNVGRIDSGVSSCQSSIPTASTANNLAAFLSSGMKIYRKRLLPTLGG